MIRVKLFFYLLLASFILSSCGNDSGKKVSRKSSGKTAEVIVSTNSEVTWESELGDSIRQFFNRDYEVLPQSEPKLELAHIPIDRLTNNKMFRAHHNIFIVEIDESVAESTIEARKDFWAAPQRVIRIVSPSKQSFIDYFEVKKEAVFNILMDSEYDRLINTFRSFPARDVQEAVQKKFGFTMAFPSGFYVAKEAPEFMWIRKETQHNSQGMMIYTYNFVDTMAFDKARILSFRNTITEEYIPGPAEGSYMTVATEYSPIVSETLDYKGKYAVETRGLWRLEGDFMGGPFVNYTFVHEKTNKVITFDAYVYAPNAPKRDLLIQMEAIIHSLKEVE